MTTWPRLWVCLLLLCSGLAQAEIKFPPLSGRVVDEAGLLSQATRAQLTQELQAHEQATSNQLVVVTLKNLQGYVIEDFGYQLGRAWGIGQKGKDNGALLIVAQQERKVRIEVGYGLEGTLTDAICANIIQTQILPQFKHGNFDQGIKAGTQAILAAIGGTYKPKAQKSEKSKPALFWVFMMFFIVMFISNLLGGSGFGGGRRRGYWGGGGFGGGGFGGGGGFSGGGGGFGGGGASGGW